MGAKIGEITMTTHSLYDNPQSNFPRLAHSPLPEKEHPQSLVTQWPFSFQPEENWFEQLWDQYQLQEEYRHSCGHY